LILPHSNSTHFSNTPFRRAPDLPQFDNGLMQKFSAQVYFNQTTENFQMANFVKKHWEDIIIYGFCALMVVGGVMVYYTFVA
jgi:hypothetical protein